ncbi:LacI family transcriptional regulator [Rubrobacter xylanophilus]|uniref:LacI family transcriptional regulator n=1 Tax=Rubrobacter xylanophilus TaxID=49319 RepID=A0A510HEJ8_9ACTN|nr:LacI family transcriptional regulator [Rubrobacter xylanophilus]
MATVSRVFGGGGVSAGARERVLEASRRLGYRPNAVARALRMEATRTLGLVIPNVMNPFFTAVARAVEDAARERGYSLVLGNTDEDPEKEARYLEVLLEKRVDGIVISPARAASPHLEEVGRAGVPVVFLDRYVEGVEAPVVRADGRRAVDELVGYLVGLGHRRLAIISGPPETVTGGERLESFLAGARRRGVEVSAELVVYGDFRRESGARAMRRLLGLEERPTAVFAANNLMALGALEELDRAGVRVPEEVSFASFDDVSWFRLLRPPVTAVAQPIRELGEAAARMLPEMVEGRGRPESVVLEAELVVRGSCAPPGGGG